jgi:hypothetical protein
MTPNTPKGYRLLQKGEVMEVGDFAWTVLNGDAPAGAEVMVGWLRVDSVYDNQKIDEGHVPVIRAI